MFGAGVVLALSLGACSAESPPVPWTGELVRARSVLDPSLAPRLEDGRAVLEAAGVRFDARDGLAVGAHALRMSLASIGRGAGRVPLDEGEAQIVGRDVRIDRGGGVWEFWSALERGLEHGATVIARPAGEGSLALVVAVEGLVPERLATGDVVLRDASGACVATYGALAVVDADGTRLPAELATEPGGIVVAVDDRHARYPLRIDPLLVTYEGALTAAAAAAGDRFGGAVALSSDGSRLVVGATGVGSGSSDEAGAAFFFTRAGASWMPEGSVSRSIITSDGRFGESVAVSADGTRALVGAPNYSGGYVWSYVRGGSWTEEGMLFAGPNYGRYGQSLALVGTRAFVGAPAARTARGTTGVIETQVHGTDWQPEATMFPADGETGDLFGQSLGADGTGTRVAGGAPGDDTAAGADAGSVRVFTRSGATFGAEATLVASDAGADDGFGSAVAMSEDGQRVVVGAPRHDRGSAVDTGAAYVFARTGTTWVEEGILAPATPQPFGHVGSAVAISGDGSRAFVGGAWEEGSDLLRAGTVRVFVRSGARWTEEALVTVPDAAINDQIGTALATPRDGSRVVLGVPLDDVGALYDAGSTRSFSFALAPLGGGCGGGAACASGFCADGVCCATSCGGDSRTDCLACARALTGVADGTCAALSAGAAPSTVCRAALGACDVEERCVAGTPTCPADVVASAGTECRPSSGICDVAEACSGTSGACPTDGFQDSGAVCRPSTAPCDGAERCTGTSVACPPDVPSPSGAVCRPATDVCDHAEVCDGTSTACPADVLEPAGVTCRAALGTCDLEEQCTGTVAACPPDTVAPVGTLCLAADPTHFCDVDDLCDGVSGLCVPRFAPASLECAPASGEICDLPDHCAGTSADCVAEFVAGVVCRPAAGGCDAPEACTGTSPGCPADELENAGVSCRASTDPACDPEETCDGLSASCPSDVVSCTDAAVDAGARDAAVSDASRSDAASSGVDAGTPSPSPAAGCACRAGVERGAPSLVLLLLALLPASIRSRRRRSE